eukprot:TRINITY_DN1286_c4_g1_i1.p1 TRINITY_DN1286_c4_g1~~TRINITY_DN1286_c4_g1_i1.p1  ORF type:complete len:834 (+),score=247.11 TRINITY_DN1286_c4_g1_i1:27-2528(+)
MDETSRVAEGSSGAGASDEWGTGSADELEVSGEETWSEEGTAQGRGAARGGAEVGDSQTGGNSYSTEEGSYAATEDSEAEIGGGNREGEEDEEAILQRLAAEKTKSAMRPPTPVTVMAAATVAAAAPQRPASRGSSASASSVASSAKSELAAAAKSPPIAAAPPLPTPSRTAGSARSSASGSVYSSYSESQSQSQPQPQPQPHSQPQPSVAVQSVKQEAKQARPGSATTHSSEVIQHQLHGEDYLVDQHSESVALIQSEIQLLRSKIESMNIVDTASPDAELHPSNTQGGQIEQLLAENEKLINAQQLLTEKYSRLQERYDHLQQQYDQLITDKSNAAMNREDLELQLRTAESKLKTREEQVAQLRKQHQEAVSQDQQQFNQSLTEKEVVLVSLQKRLKEVKEQLTTEQGRTQALEHEVTSLTQQLQSGTRKQPLEEQLSVGGADWLLRQQQQQQQQQANAEEWAHERERLERDLRAAQQDARIAQAREREAREALGAAQAQTRGQNQVPAQLTTQLQRDNNDLSQSLKESLRLLEEKDRHLNSVEQDKLIIAENRNKLQAKYDSVMAQMTEQEAKAAKLQQALNEQKRSVQELGDSLTQARTEFNKRLDTKRAELLKAKHERDDMQRSHSLQLEQLKLTHAAQCKLQQEQNKLESEQLTEALRKQTKEAEEQHRAQLEELQQQFNTLVQQCQNAQGEQTRMLQVELRKARADAKHVRGEGEALAESLARERDAAQEQLQGEYNERMQLECELRHMTGELEQMKQKAEEEVPRLQGESDMSREKIRQLMQQNAELSVPFRTHARSHACYITRHISDILSLLLVVPRCFAATQQ